ncbi:hypothetical protein ABTI79_20260, partial [Acinetobacter baumannii]
GGGAQFRADFEPQARRRPDGEPAQFGYEPGWGEALAALRLDRAALGRIGAEGYAAAGRAGRCP